MNRLFQSVQRTLVRLGIRPDSRLFRLSAALGTLAALWTLFGNRGFLYALTVFLFLATLLLVLLRAFSQRFMWQLRNRLIVTYVFIAVIPVVLLVVMGFVAGFMFAGQFSTFVVTTDLRNELQRLESSNQTITHQATFALRDQGRIVPSQFGFTNQTFPGRSVTVFYRDHAENLVSSGARETLTPPPEGFPTSAIVLDGGELYLRAVDHAVVNDHTMTVVSSVPLDRLHMEAIVRNMGRIDVYSERSSGAPPQASRRQGSLDLAGTDIDVAGAPKISCGAVPPAAWRLDSEFGSFTPVQNVIHWQSGAPKQLLLIVRTRPSLLYNRLFRTLGEWTSATYLGLASLAALFALIEVVAFVIGMRLTRTMTSSVSKLYRATQFVNAGDLSHRIHVQSRDQLASLEGSFNSMTESLEKLIAEQKEKQRIESELFIAKEVQDLLFPKDAADLDGLELHGVCRPARTVSGDYYDFLPAGHNAIGLAVGDISGKGISAALMMATVHAFVRAHTLVEAPVLTAQAAPGGSPRPIIDPGCCPSPATVLALLNQQLYRSTPAQKYATMFLGFYDQEQRRLTYSNAGHLPPIVVCANGSSHLLSVGGTVVGLFGNMVYPEGSVILNPGDIVVAYSDGITEPENDFGDFGEERLIQIVRENRDQPLARISEAILAAVLDWIGGEEQPDDMTIVLARAR